MRPISVSAFRASHRPRRRGALTVEMALITPVLLVLIVGIMQVGYAFMVQHAMQDVARQACREASLRTRSQTGVASLIQSQLQAEGITPSRTVSTIMVNELAQDVTTASAGDEVSVRITMKLADVALFPGFFSNFSGTMQGSFTMRCE